MAVASAWAIASVFWLEASATAKAKASAMDLAVPSAAATAFAPLPGWQLEPATRASVLPTAMATASASASALACTASTQQASVSSHLKCTLWQGRTVNVAAQEIVQKSCTGSHWAPPHDEFSPRTRTKMCPPVLPYLCKCFQVLAIWGRFKRFGQGLGECLRFLRSR